ncbi:uncharacterized protein UDID_17251 [Ustilago sp. UG-2017a]|nr:uncharacterized protein UDID_17251 [Ustilago sp. UG-2017a]
MQQLGKIRDVLDALGKILLFSQAHSFPLASLSPARFPLSSAFRRTSLLCICRLRLRPVDGIE